MKAKWSEYKNFSESEFRCSETGENDMEHGFMLRLQALRSAYGKPMVITSGYRSPKHSIEAKKATPGTHAQGIAADIKCSRGEAHKILKLAMEMGFTGIGVQQKGNARFIHLDTRDEPTVWSY